MAHGSCLMAKRGPCPWAWGYYEAHEPLTINHRWIKRWWLIHASFSTSIYTPSVCCRNCAGVLLLEQVFHRTDEFHFHFCYTTPQKTHTNHKLRFPSHSTINCRQSIVEGMSKLPRSTFPIIYFLDIPIASHNFVTKRYWTCRGIVFLLDRWHLIMRCTVTYYDR